MIARDPTRVINIYISSVSEDEDLLKHLEKHLCPLKNAGWVKTFTIHNILGGGDYKYEKEMQFHRADIILLLISPDFLASNECVAEMQEALVRYEAGRAFVLSILLRPTHWEISPASQFWVLPSNKQPVRTWNPEDAAFVQVARGIHELANILHSTALPYEKGFLPQTIAIICNKLHQIDREQTNRYITEQYEQDLEKYIQYLQKTYKYLKIVGIVPKDQQKDPELDSLFVPLHIEVQDQTIVVEKKQDSLVEALLRYYCVILLGGPGSGKSTAVRHLACSHALANLQEDSASSHSLLPGNPLPLHIDLRRLSEESRRYNYSFLSYITEVVLQREGIEIKPQLFHELLQQGKLLLLFDGLDEVATLNERKQLVEEIERFALNHTGNYILVTSRPVGYESAPFSQQWFAQARVQDFDDEQIRQFLERWHTYVLQIPQLSYADRQELETLSTTLKYNPHLHKLAVNPLLLTVITVLHRYERLPDRRVLIYDRCADLLLETWARLKGTDIRWKDMKIGKEDQYACVAHLGFVLHQGTYKGYEDTEEKRGQKNEASNEEPASDVSTRFMLREIERCIQSRNLITEVAVQRVEAKRFLDLIQIEAGLIVERGKNENGEGLYGFLHRTFQEYFAAIDVYERFQQDVDLTIIRIFLGEHLHDPHWQEVILLLLAKLKTKPVTILLGHILEGKIKSQRSQYNEVLQQDLFFVCSCLLEGITIEDKLAQDIFTRLSTIIKYSSFTPQKTQALNLLATYMHTQQYTDIAKQTLSALLTTEDVQSTPLWLEVLHTLYVYSASESAERRQIMEILLNNAQLTCEQVLQAAQRIDMFRRFTTENGQDAIQILVTLAQRPELSVEQITRVAQHLYRQSAPVSQERHYAIQMLLNLEKRVDLPLEQALEVAEVWLNTIYDATRFSASCTPAQLRERRRVAQWILKIAQRTTLSVEQALHLVAVLYLGMHSPQEERKQAASVLFKVAERPKLPFTQKMVVISHICQYDHSNATKQRVLTLLLHLSQSDLSRDQKVQIAKKLCIYSSPSSKIRRQAIEMLAEATQLTNASPEGIIGPILEVYYDVCKYKSSNVIKKKTATFLLRLVRAYSLSFEQKVQIASALIVYDSGIVWTYEQGTHILLDIVQQTAISDKQTALVAQVLYRSNYQKARKYGWQLLWSMIERFEENIEQAVLAALAPITSGSALYYDDGAKNAANILLDVLLLQPGLSPEYALEAVLVLYRYFSGSGTLEKQKKTACILLRLAQNQMLPWEQRLRVIQVLYQTVSITGEEQHIITQLFWQFVEEHHLTVEQKLQALALPLITSGAACMERVKAVRMVLTLLEEDAARQYLEQHWSPLNLEIQGRNVYAISSLFDLMMQEKLPVRVRDEIYTILRQMVPYFDQFSA